MKYTFETKVISIAFSSQSNCRTSVGLNEDTIGGLVKAGISQYLALEITRGNSRDNRAITKYLPWLNNPPTTVTQG